MQQSYNLKEYSLKNLPDEKWEVFLKSARGASVMHSVEFLKWVDSQGNKVTILTTEIDSKIIAALTLTDFSVIPGFYFKTYYPLAPFNSLIAVPDVPEKIYESLIGAIKAKSFQVSPYLCIKLSDFSSLMPSRTLTGFSVEKHTGFTISLNEPKVVFPRFSESLKRYLKKFYTTISVEDASINDIDDLYELFMLRDKKINIKSFNKAYYEKFLFLAKKNLVDWKVARLENKIVATAIFWNDSDEIIYSDSAVNNSIFPQVYPKVESILWSVMQNKFKIGCKQLILGESIGQKNLTEFKNKWGAEEIEYNVYFKNTLAYNIGYKLQPLVKKIWRPY